MWMPAGRFGITDQETGMSVDRDAGYRNSIHNFLLVLKSMACYYATKWLHINLMEISK